MQPRILSANIEPLHHESIAAALALNNAHAKETSALNGSSLKALMAISFYARGTDGGSSALLIALSQDAPYENSNFAWFHRRYADFVYIDRVIVAAHARGRGLARLLYDDLFQESVRAGHRRVVCEVNLDPPNPASDAFHVRMGFVAVGQAVLYDVAKTVRYFERPL
jgi:uncharacterized protein